MLYIQDPSYENSILLHESLVNECSGASYGGGAYAFATRDGIVLFFSDANFKSFIKKGKYCLIVGTDDITNEAAVNELIYYKHKYGPNLTVYAYIHNPQGSTFHPKFSWFQKEDGGSLVIGSGNLTPSGLRRNREAYNIIKYNQNEMQTIITEWEKWINHSKSFLFDIEDPVVLKKAKKNAVSAKTLYRAKAYAEKANSEITNNELKKLYQSQPKNKNDEKVTKILNKGKEKKSASVSEKDYHILNSDVSASVQNIEQEDFDVDTSFWDFNLENNALIAEVPKSTGRDSQVNFSKDIFENFFGATCGENGKYRILLRSINRNGELGEIEIRPGVSSTSHNWRFELDGAKGLVYPVSDERPIAMFVKISSREFLYEFFMPDDDNYNDIMRLLLKKEKPSRYMRRIIFKVEDIYSEIKDLPIWIKLELDE